MRRGGFEVVTAADGDEAVLALDPRPDFDLVITDMVMPGRYGVQVARDAAVRLPGVPVLVISGHVGSDDGHEKIRDGRYAFLHKPFRPSELLGIVSELLGDGTASGGQGPSGPVAR